MLLARYMYNKYCTQGNTCTRTVCPSDSVHRNHREPATWRQAEVNAVREGKRVTGGVYLGRQYASVLYTYEVR